MSRVWYWRNERHVDFFNIDVWNVNSTKKPDFPKCLAFRLLDWICWSLLYVIWNLVNAWTASKSTIVRYGCYKIMFYCVLKWYFIHFQEILSWPSLNVGNWEWNILNLTQITKSVQYSWMISLGNICREICFKIFFEMKWIWDLLALFCLIFLYAELEHLY